MLKVNGISNVNNTLNNKIKFGAGVQSNYGLQSNSPTIYENGFIAGFWGTIKDSFSNKVKERANTIEENMSNKLDLVA